MKEIEKQKLPKLGFIKLITGPMFSGKTSHLLKEIWYYNKIRKWKHMIFKPVLDLRNQKQKNQIVTHNLLPQEARKIKKNQELLEIINQEKNAPRIIFISEVNFFASGFSETLDKISKKGINIVCEGLNKDYLGNYFPEIKKILEKKPKLKLLYANCYRCFKKAGYSKRLNDNKEIIFVGGKESYLPACQKCYKLKI